MPEDRETNKKAPPDDEKIKGSPRDLLRLLRYVKPYRLRFAIAFSSLLVAALMGLAAPQVIRFIIDAAFSERDTAKLNQMAVLLVIVFAFQAFFSFIRTYLLSYIGERIVADVRTELYTHLTTLPVSFFASRRVGELTSRLSSDVSVVQTATTGGMAELLRQGLVLVGGVAIIAYTNLQLTLVMLAIIPPVIVAALFYGRYVRRLSTRVQDRLAEANSVLEETLGAIRIVQSFVREEYERRRYRRRIDDALALAVRRAVASGGFVAFIILVAYSGIAVVLWFGSRMVLSGEVTAGQLIAFVLYTFVVAAAIGGMSELYGMFNQAIGATRRIFELLDTEPEIKDSAGAAPLADVRGSVELKDVRFTYPDDRGIEILKGVTILARPGEIIALVGPSGAGKSTLVALVPRFYDV
ncbi:MAG TPA: ABC transporter transmembrane domain-containing protein, partial [Blastocatellia bacterium]|nr:ABC transporter transmembrane domain-containing protein [Blastocatellia bacterium]